MKPLCEVKWLLLSFLHVRWNRKRQRDSGFHWLNGYHLGTLTDSLILKQGLSFGAV